jgi:hypothetical protein
MSVSAESAAPAFPVWRAVLLLLVGAAVLSSPWLAGSVTVPWDAKAHFQPQLQFLASSLHSGQSPFWTPNIFAGHPQVADPQSLIFSPPFLMLALLDPAPSLRMMDAVSFASLVAGGIGVIVWFRDRGWHEAGAVLAALAFAFGGAAAWRIQHVGQVVSLAWWPIALLLLDRGLRRGSLGCGFLAGVSAGFMLLGRDQVAYLGLLLLAAYVPALLAGKGFSARLRRALPAILAGGLGGALTVALPMLLTLALAADSNRPTISLVEAGKGSLHPASLLTAVIPHLFGISRPLTDYWGPPSPDWGWVDLYLARNMATFYFGALPVLGCALAIAGWWRADRSREAAFLLAGFAAMMLYSLGRYTPFFVLAFQIPGVDMFRRPADALFPAAALGAMAGGYGLHLWLLRPGWSLSPVLLRGLSLAFAACLATGLALAWSIGRQQQTLLPLFAASAFMLAAALMLALLRRMQAAGVLPAMAVAAIVTVDLAWNNAPNESTGLPPATYEVLEPASANPTIALLKRSLAGHAAPDRRDRVELAGVGFHWPNATLVHGLDHTLGYNPVRSKLYSETVGARDHIAGPDQRLFTPLFPSYGSPLANLAGLRYIVTPVPLSELDPKADPAAFPQFGRTVDGFVYENPRALPRVLFAGEARQADFARMTREGGWPDIDFTRTVLLEGPQPTAGGSSPDAGGTARIVSYANTEVIAEATSAAGGWLVLNDVWHPWWYASIDGREVPLLRANVTFRAVAVPAGTHRVVFRFRPFRGAWEQWRAGRQKRP